MNPGLMAAINMKLRKPLVAIVISLFALVSLSNTASAHSADDIPPALASILVKTAAIFNSLLDYWVNSATGNTLTDSAGTPGDFSTRPLFTLASSDTSIPKDLALALILRPAFALASSDSKWV